MTQELAQAGASAAGTAAAEGAIGENGSVVFPASFGQQRLWFLSCLEPESTAYAMPLLAKLSGPLDRVALTRALSGLIERHEILRTTFSERDGDVVQHVLPATPVQLDVMDVSERPDRETAGLEIALRTLGQPFDLASGPLFRSVLVALQEDEHLLVLALHHVVADGWSIGVLKRDLGELYAAEVERRPAALPDLVIQYGDYAAWQREWLQGPRLEEQLDYWRGELDGAPPLLELPTDQPRPAIQGFRGAHRRRALD